MARKSSWNPIAFVPAQVTIISSIVYIALFAVLIWVHHTVPSAPSNAVPVAGVNLTQAWLDLSYISDGFHPIDRTEATAPWVALPATLYQWAGYGDAYADIAYGEWVARATTDLAARRRYAQY